MPTLSEQGYVSLIRHIFPQVRITSIRPETSGWASFVLEVNGNTIFRFPLRPDVEEELRKEIRLLPDLASFLAVPVPDYEYVWEGDATHPLPFVGYGKIEGVHPHRAMVTSEIVPTLVSSIGVFLSKLHEYPVDRATSLGVPDFTQEGWWRVHTKFDSNTGRIIRDYVSDNMWEQINNRWRSLQDTATTSAFRPTFVHNDLFSSHVFCDAENGTLTGVIDWGDAAVGDPAKDFGGLLYDCGEDFTKQIIAAYTGDTGSNFWERVRFYAYRIHFSEILHAHQTGDISAVKARLEQLRADTTSEVPTAS